MNYQNITLLGRATKDSALVSSKDGKQFSAFSVAVNRYMGKDQDSQAQYYDCLVFGEKQASNAYNKIKKGDIVTLWGRPETEAYINKEGEPKANIKVIVDDWQVLK